jgi:KDO2-lipid IV(A) lauroyltransferase
VILGLLALIDRLMRLLPLGAARGLGSALGRTFFACVPYERKKTLAVLEKAYPASDAAWRGRTARDVFGHLGRSAAEFFRLADLGPQGIAAWVAEVEGFEHLERPVREGRGVVAVTAHFGHWELLAAWVAQRLPTAVVARQVYDARLDAVLTARREGNKVGVFGRNTSVRPILRWLKDGKVLGVLADQDTGVDSLYVEFFGHAAKTPSGPAVLAQATGADLVTGFCYRRPDGRYRLAFGPPIPLPARGTGGALELWAPVQEYTRRTEEAIRSAPTLWAWNHSRWRSDIHRASTGWDPRLAQGCLDRVYAWRAAGRPALG